MYLRLEMGGFWGQPVQTHLQRLDPWATDLPSRGQGELNSAPHGSIGQEDTRRMKAL